jgi:PAS domain S-box-containing protein
MGFSKTTFADGPATVGFILDITDRKHAEAALRDSELQFRTIIEGAPIAISIGRNGKIIYANQVYANMHGFASADEVIGCVTEERIAPRDRKVSLECAKNRAQDALVKDTSYELCGLRKDGSEFPMLVEISRVNLADGPANIGFFLDLSERKQADAALNQRNAELAALNQIGQALTTLATPAEILERVFTQIGKVVDNRNIYIAIYH